MESGLSVKAQARQLIDELPDDATWGDVAQALQLPFAMEQIQLGHPGSADPSRDHLLDNLMMRGISDLLEGNQFADEELMDDFDLQALGLEDSFDEMGWE